MSPHAALRPADLAFVASSVVCGSVGQVLLRLGARDIGISEPFSLLAEALTTPLVLAGLAAYVVSSALWIVVLSRVRLAVAYPLGASNYFVVAVLATLLGEDLSPTRWLGTFVIVTGVALVGAGGGDRR